MGGFWGFRRGFRGGFGDWILGRRFWVDFGMDFGMDFDVDFGRIFCRIFFAADFRIFPALAVDFCAGFFLGRIFWRRILFSITFAT